MREIKFRAWDSQRKQFIPEDDEVFALDNKGHLLIAKNESFLLSPTPAFDGYWPSEEVKNYVLLQYTGLKDKNGKEIYEGDIVQWWNKVSEPEVVESTNGGWNPFIDSCTTDHPYHYEVIGNIYENPELLGEK